MNNFVIFFKIKNYLRIFLILPNFPHQCDSCSKKFLHLSNLIIHKRIHTDEKPFVCNFCPKKFVQSSNLSLHERIHTGEKPYHCDSCLMKFSQLISLKIHLKSHLKNQFSSLDGELFFL